MSKAPREKETWCCVFCLEVSPTACQEDSPLGPLDLPPTGCPHCRVGWHECGTRLKVGAEICDGCGAILPGVVSRFVACSSSSSIYAEASWRRDGLPKRKRVCWRLGFGWRAGENQSAVKPRYMRLRYRVSDGEDMGAEVDVSARDAQRLSASREKLR